MGVIKDFLHRQEIETRAKTLVAEQFTDLVMKRITESNDDKKSQRKLDNASRQLKLRARKLISEMKLGSLYGKPRFLKSLQDSLFGLGLDDAVVRKIIKSLV